MNSHASATEQNLAGVLSGVNAALQGVQGALCDVFEALNSGARAAEEIMCVDSEPSAKIAGWQVIEGIRKKHVCVSESLALELAEALRRGRWRKAKHPAAYLYVAV